MTDAPTTSSAARPDHLGFRHPDSAVRYAGAHAWLWCVAVLGLAADLGTKSWAFQTLDPLQPRPWIKGLLEFHLSLNAGALFGMGAGKGSLFIVASVAALGFVLYLFAGTERRQHLLHMSLGLILAGALGNLYDRAVHKYDRVHFSDSSDALLGQVETEANGQRIVFRPWFNPGQAEHRAASELREPVRRVGVVRDFLRITVRIGNRSLWPWVFNVADAMLVVGVGLLIIGYWRAPKTAPAPVQQAAVSPSNS